jgi:hypothetical protein
VEITAQETISVKATKAVGAIWLKEKRTGYITMALLLM